MKKNCKNCRHLDYFEADFESFDSSGYYCNKREDESIPNKMEKDSYLEKSKVCFVQRIEVTPIAPPNEVDR